MLLLRQTLPCAFGATTLKHTAFSHRWIYFSFDARHMPGSDFCRQCYATIPVMADYLGLALLGRDAQGLSHARADADLRRSGDFCGLCRHSAARSSISCCGGGTFIFRGSGFCWSVYLLVGGAAHVLSAFGEPAATWAAAMKVALAFVSWIWVIVLIPLVPQLLEARTAEEFTHLRQQARRGRASPPRNGGRL